MSVKEKLTAVAKAIDEVIAEVHKEKHDDGMPDEEAGEIIDTMQLIEDKLSNLLAEYGVEVGDERID